jgi:hypothetical protein
MKFIYIYIYMCVCVCVFVCVHTHAHANTSTEGPKKLYTHIQCTSNLLVQILFNFEKVLKYPLLTKCVTEVINGHFQIYIYIYIYIYI